MKISDKIIVIIKNNKAVLFSFCFILGILFYTYFTPNYFPGNSEVEYLVKKGDNMSKVVEDLYKLKVIPNKTNFKIAAFITGADKKLRAGYYRFKSGTTYFELIDLLTSEGHNFQKLVTLPEGLWQHKMAQILQKEAAVDSSEFINLSYDVNFIRKLGLDVNNLEGYLLPETYYFEVPASAEDVIKKLKSENDKIFSDSVLQQIKEMGLTRHKILTLASIIEGESNKPSEFKTISGVYHNRLKKGMLLQADPTIQFLKRHRNDKNRILYKDLEINSPYNTYIYAGLPPGPINNPGKDAILAAIYPEKNNYLFFVADGNGGHNFSRTYGEHLVNQNKYRIWRDSQ
ncbi:MAG: endolytic transglycosylase MltG [Ignavibacteria bacterium]|nr:endolytic transglycosylase MltG [Ignavibacteria bacterium]